MCVTINGVFWENVALSRLVVHIASKPTFRLICDGARKVKLPTAFEGDTQANVLIMFPNRIFVFHVDLTARSTIPLYHYPQLDIHISGIALAHSPMYTIRHRPLNSFLVALVSRFTQ